MKEIHEGILKSISFVFFFPGETWYPKNLRVLPDFVVKFPFA
jgi:hypothetical protein